MSGPTGRWVADASIGWRILLSAKPEVPLDRALVATRLTEVYDAQGWGAAPDVVDQPTPQAARLLLAETHAAPLRLATGGGWLVVSAHHAAVDGLGLLEVLGRVIGHPVTSDARGVGNRPDGPGLARTVASRLAEVAVRPPLRPALPASEPLPGDVMVDLEVAGRWRAPDLVHAAAGAIRRHQVGAGRRDRRVAVAVGATRAPRPFGARLADDSVLLRLRDVERLTRSEVAAQLREAVPHASPHDAGGAGRVLGLGIRLMAPRLGSTLLVSHLGNVAGLPGEHLAFHPVTAGGSGLSLGAVGLGDRTTLSLRARASQWNDNDLELLLEAVVSLL